MGDKSVSSQLGLKMVNVKNKLQPVLLPALLRPDPVFGLGERLPNTLYSGDNNGVAVSTFDFDTNELLMRVTIPRDLEIGPIRDVASSPTDENLVAIAGASGWSIWTLKDRPSRISFVPFEQSALGISWQGDLIYVVGDQNRLFIYNVLDPAKPMSTTTVDLIGASQYYDVRAYKAYIITASASSSLGSKCDFVIVY